ncbi:MAG: hypothetical protein ACLSGB_01040 [Dorea sp.]
MMITNWFAKKRGLAMSIAMAGIGVGGTIFSPVSNYVYLENTAGDAHTRIVALMIIACNRSSSCLLPSFTQTSPRMLGLKPLRQ